MFNVKWDKNNNGIQFVASDDIDIIHGAPRPVFYEELDLLGFDKYWNYPKSKDPLLWAVERRYFYNGIFVAEVNGGNYFDSPRIKITEDGLDLMLNPMNLEHILARNEDFLFLIEHEAIEFIHLAYKMYGGSKDKVTDSPELDWSFDTAKSLSKEKALSYTVIRQTCGSVDIVSMDEAILKNKVEYKAKKVDQFVASFSGGKDSQVTLDLVTRAIPPSEYAVIYSDTGMEIPPSIKIFDETKRHYESRFSNIKFHLTSNQQDILTYWQKIGAPTRMHRWCCAVMKTGPFYRFLKSMTPNNKQPKVLVFEGVRAEESQKRSTYSRIGTGVKHSTVVNARPIFHWNTTEIFLYMFKYALPINEGYRKGLTRVGCSVCPLSSEWSEHIIKKLYPEKVNPYIDIIHKQTKQIGLADKTQREDYIKVGNWKKRAGGNAIGEELSRLDIMPSGNDFKAVLTNPKENIFEWLKTLGTLKVEQHSSFEYTGEFRYQNEIISFSRNDIVYNPTQKKIVLIFNNLQKNILLQSLIKKILYKTTYCIHCEVCEVECPTGALSVVPFVSINSKKCIHCLNCLGVNEKGCVMAKSINSSEGSGVKSQMKTSGIDKYSTFGLKEKWLRKYFENPNGYFEADNNDLGVKMVPAAINWLRDAELMDRKQKIVSDLGDYLKDKYNYEPDLIWEIIWVNLFYNSGIITSYINKIKWNELLSKKELIYILKEDYPTLSEATVGNPVGALLNMISNTPFGSSVKIGTIEKRGNAVKSIKREPLTMVSSVAIAYALYKMAEKLNRYDFRLSELVSGTCTGSVVSMFGISENNLKLALRGLQESKHALLTVELEKGLDNIKLREDYTSLQVLKLILG